MSDTTVITVHTSTSPSDIKGLIDHSRHVLGATRRHRWDEGPSRIYMPGAYEYVMRPDQGLPLWLKLFHNQGRVLPPLGDHGARYVEIWLDSGARADHDRIRGEIGRWMTGRGWVWRWKTDHTSWQQGRR